MLENIRLNLGRPWGGVCAANLRGGVAYYTHLIHVVSFPVPRLNSIITVCCMFADPNSNY